MSVPVAWCGLADLRIASAKRRAGKRVAKEGGQDKSACHERRKPLVRLGLSCAYAVVAGKLPGFCQRFQRFDMHSGELRRRRGGS